jgi:hypothetical protein
MTASESIPSHCENMWWQNFENTRDVSRTNLGEKCLRHADTTIIRARQHGSWDNYPKSAEPEPISLV